MTLLPTEFTGTRDQKGYHFKVLKRRGDVCLVEKHNPAHKSGQKLYEVIIVGKVPERRWPDGRLTSAHEAMPSPEEWGMRGWSTAILAHAEDRFSQLTTKK